MQLLGGELVVDYSSDEIRLMGSAVTVFHGVIEIGVQNEN